jgi:hypothetical protein
VPESYFSLSEKDKAELLDTAAARSGRPAHLLEKDIWVVWSLSAIFASPLERVLTFKGGTSLSKAYGAIDRFSEDIDLTCDIRALLPDMVNDAEGIPLSSSQASKWTKAVHERLPQWITGEVLPIMCKALPENLKTDSVRITEPDSLIVEYAPIREGTGYIAPKIRLEFGARSTGEPFEVLPVACDLAALMPEIRFPQAAPRVLKMERTFWEKATAIHVFCKQVRMRGDRFSRHWYDITQLAKTERIQKSLPNKEWLRQVVRHKSIFFVEKNTIGKRIDYNECLNGTLQLSPIGASLNDLRRDYNSMIRDGIISGTVMDFDSVLRQCSELEDTINKLFIE